jgi:hypothetical protein
MTAERTNNTRPACAEACKKEILNMIELCLDGELTGEREKELMNKINSCPECTEMLSSHQSYKKFMQLKIERKCCCKEVKSRILQNIDSIA